MKKTTVNLYEFDELNEEVKKKVIEKHSNFLAESMDLIFVVDEWEAKLKDLGYIDPKISYRGFYCQGDGASFTASLSDDLIKETIENSISKFPLLNKHIKEILDSITITFYRNHSLYSHEKSVSIDMNSEYLEGKIYEEVKEELVLLEEFLDEKRISLCKEIYKSLEHQYEYCLSDEYIIEDIKLNEYMYLLDGSIANIY